MSVATTCGMRALVGEFRGPPKKVYTFSSLGDYGIPKSERCTHSATEGQSAVAARPPHHSLYQGPAPIAALVVGPSGCSSAAIRSTSRNASQGADMHKHHRRAGVAGTRPVAQGTKIARRPRSTARHCLGLGLPFKTLFKDILLCMILLEHNRR